MPRIKYRTCILLSFNSVWPSDTVWPSYMWINIGSGNGSLPDGTKPLPEPMLTFHQGGSDRSAQATILCNEFEYQNIATSPRGQWVNCQTAMISYKILLLALSNWIISSVKMYSKWLMMKQPIKHVSPTGGPKSSTTTSQLTLKGPIPYIYGTQVWLSLCLQMS